MLYRKISSYIEEYLRSGNDKILLIEGARQIGKSFIVREIGRQVYPHFIEINFVQDDEGPQLFKEIHSTEEFYLRLSSIAGTEMIGYNETLIFLDEIQHYPQYLTLLKFFREERKFRFIASGSLLGIALRQTTSIPVGSVIRKRMFQLDFEEWLIANNYGETAINHLKTCYHQLQSLTEQEHTYLLSLFKRYLLVGGLPDVVNEYLSSHNIVKVRELQRAIMDLYLQDAAKYEQEAKRKLHIQRIYELISSQMENKKKRVVVKDIQDKKGDRFDNYTEEFEYLVSSGIAMEVKAISNPRFPLSESVHKNLLKLYHNDVGLLTAKLYNLSLKAVLDTDNSVNLGSVYENVVAQELLAHEHELFYYDNKVKGEVDFIINDFVSCSVVPVEVKSGKDYTVHSALTQFVTNPDYGIEKAIVLSNEREVRQSSQIQYLPVYFVMFMHATQAGELSAEESTF